MNAARRLGLLGGTLDPIHLGHVETAKQARIALGLERVIVLPSRVPPHRLSQPVASRYHRFAMSALAVNGVDGLEVSDLELCAPGPSYTADTLTRFRNSSDFSSSQIFFITGADAFAEIATWYRYPEVLDLAHFVVVSRPRFPAETMRERLPSLAGRMITVRDSGLGTRDSPGTRDSGLGTQDSAIFLVDAATPDVSSTDVRRRIASGESLDGLVPAAVETHIVQHGLYTRTSATSTANHLHGEN
ncbi:MAG TPA: nicotinate-nucleotide adenylyltransferase [Vicinamibacterales bacterium]|nr:nicotinate-nucleotide adenylyltransferase [Vicinamibacterales bacterium]